MRGQPTGRRFTCGPAGGSASQRAGRARRPPESARGWLAMVGHGAAKMGRAARPRLGASQSGAVRRAPQRREESPPRTACRAHSRCCRRHCGRLRRCRLRCRQRQQCCKMRRALPTAKRRAAAALSVPPAPTAASASHLWLGSDNGVLAKRLKVVLVWGRGQNRCRRRSCNTRTWISLKGKGDTAE